MSDNEVNNNSCNLIYHYMRKRERGRFLEQERLLLTVKFLI